MALDPNWLMSTTAQAAAAIVAIVGGFLVSRLITANSERRSLRRQLADAVLRCESAAELERESRNALLKWDAWELHDDQLTHILEKDGQVSVGDLLARDPKTTWTESDFQSALEPILAEYRRAYKMIAKAPAELLAESSWPDLLSILSKQGLHFNEEQNDIFEAVFDELAYRARRGRTQGSSLPVDIPPNLIRPNVPSRRPALVEQVETARRNRRSAEQELQRARDAISELPTSRDLWPGFAVLAYFSLSGVVLPLVMIALQTTNELSDTRKLVVLLGFGSGFLALAAYLIQQIRRLDPSDSSRHDAVGSVRDTDSETHVAN